MIVDFSDNFKKRLKKLKNDRAIKRLNKVLKTMNESSDGNLNNMFGDHQLTDNLVKYRELHLDNDYLLVYKINLSEGIIELDGIYTHKELDKKKASLTIFSNLKNFSNLWLFLRN